MTAAFDKALAFVLRHEGGLVNDPSDPGGLTNYGISQRAYPDLDIASLTRDEAASIYAADYWRAANCHMLPPAVALVVFDCAVNQGVATAKKLLQRAVGAVEDGLIGPATIAAATAKGREAVVDLTVLRLQRYQQSPVFARFGRGWMRRAISAAMEASNA